MEYWRLSLVVLVACKQDATKLDRSLAPPVHAGIVIDGELREPAWNARAQRAVFGDGDGNARPYSEIRLLREGPELYVALYAADEDIRKTDAFDLDLGPLALRLPARGGVLRRLGDDLVPAPPEVRAMVDADGTIDQPADDDEEWVVELALPVSLIGSAPHIAARRCDHPKAGGERCGGWSGVLK